MISPPKKTLERRRGFATGLEMARSACERRRDEPLVRYFGGCLTGRDVDDASDALACALAERGISRGDRVALYLQNVPQMPIAIIAAWKLGAIVVPVNPMLRDRELAVILRDSAARALISLDELHEGVARRVLPDTAVETPITTSPLAYLDDVPPLLEGRVAARPADAEDL